MGPHVQGLGAQSKEKGEAAWPGVPQMEDSGPLNAGCSLSLAGSLLKPQYSSLRYGDIPPNMDTEGGTRASSVPPPRSPLGCLPLWPD